jgi:hypothetical protein
VANGMSHEEHEEHEEHEKKRLKDEVVDSLDTSVEWMCLMLASCFFSFFVIFPLLRVLRVGSSC